MYIVLWALVGCRSEPTSYKRALASATRLSNDGRRDYALRDVAVGCRALEPCELVSASYREACVVAAMQPHLSGDVAFVDCPADARIKLVVGYRADFGLETEAGRLAAMVPACAPYVHLDSTPLESLSGRVENGKVGWAESPMSRFFACVEGKAESLSWPKVSGTFEISVRESK
jgi:hypothetical protein